MAHDKPWRKMATHMMRPFFLSFKVKSSQKLTNLKQWISLTNATITKINKIKQKEMNKKANSLIKKKLTKYNTQKRKYKSLSNGNLTERSAF